MKDLKRHEVGWYWNGLVGAIFLSSVHWYLQISGGVIFALSLLALYSLEKNRVTES
jgi:hypothetical protein